MRPLRATSKYIGVPGVGMNAGSPGLNLGMVASASAPWARIDWTAS